MKGVKNHGKHCRTIYFFSFFLALQALQQHSLRIQNYPAHQTKMSLISLQTHPREIKNTRTRTHKTKTAHLSWTALHYFLQHAVCSAQRRFTLPPAWRVASGAQALHHPWRGAAVDGWHARCAPLLWPPLLAQGAFAPSSAVGHGYAAKPSPHDIDFLWSQVTIWPAKGNYMAPK